MPDLLTKQHAPEQLDGVERSLEELQAERCNCLEQLHDLINGGAASDRDISSCVQRIDAINGIMLSLARATTALAPEGDGKGISSATYGARPAVALTAIGNKP